MTGSPRPIRDAVSAGGVVWRRVASGSVEVVLCGRTPEHALRSGHGPRETRLWVLPKGTPDIGESIEETALREVREETGLVVRMGESLGKIDYWFVANGERIHKRVFHWLMEPAGGNLADHDAEFDAVSWLPLADAMNSVTYDNERQVLEQAALKIGECA